MFFLRKFIAKQCGGDKLCSLHVHVHAGNSVYVQFYTFSRHACTAFVHPRQADLCVASNLMTKVIAEQSLTSLLLRGLALFLITFTCSVVLYLYSPNCKNQDGPVVNMLLLFVCDHTSTQIHKIIWKVQGDKTYFDNISNTVNVKIFVFTIFCGLNFWGDKYLWVRVAHQNPCC